MQFSALAFIFLQQAIVPQIVTPSSASCAMKVELTENSVFIRPNVLGIENIEGKYELTAETVTGSNSSFSMQSGTFVIRETNIFQTVAVLQLSRGAQTRIGVVMNIFIDGQMSKCEISYP